MSAHDAISLGESRWLDLVDLTGRYAAAINIDTLLAESEPMWLALQTQCTPGCCGLHAFDFWPSGIAAAAEVLDRRQVCSALDSLRRALRGLETDVVVSERLNHYMDRGVFEALIDHLQRAFACSSA